MTDTITALVPAAAAEPPVARGPVHADSDARLIELWLHGKSPRTRRAYGADVAGLLARAQTPLSRLTLGDLQAYQDRFAARATATQARKLSAIKSLLSFGHTLGYLSFNVGAPIKLPAIRQTLAERILSEDAVFQMLALERQPRNKALLRLLYLGGLRIGEACGLRMRDLQPNGESGQICIFGKGGKTRVVLLKASLWADLLPLRSPDPDAAVFGSRQGGALDPSQVHRIVKAAAARAGLSADVSAHWLRHAHVSHALDRGAPAHLVQATVGHASLATTSRYAHARPNDSSSRYLAG